MPDHRPAVYLEGNNVIYRASSLGHCLRSLWAARSNMDRKPIPDVILKGMNEGTNLEPIIIELLFTKHGFTFADGGAGGAQEVVELNLGEWNDKILIVRGALDEVGCVYDATLDREHQPHRPIDVKAFTEPDVAKYLKHGIKGFPRYAWQQSVYAHGFGTDEGYMPIFHKGTWEMVPQSLTPIKPVYTIGNIEERVLQVEEAFLDGVMPDCPTPDYACQYPYLHDATTVDTLTDLQRSIIQAGIVIRQKITHLNTLKTKLDDKLKGELEKDVAYHFDGYTISVFANPNRFNTDAAKEILTSAEIDWQNDPLFQIPGKGVQVRFNPPKKGSSDAEG